MDTFKQSKVIATVSLMLGLFVSGGAVWAGPSSILDPYAEIAPPSGRAAKQQRSMMPEATTQQTSTTYVNMDTDKAPSPIRIKKPHFGGHTVKPEKQAVAKTKVEKVKTAHVDTQKVQTKKSSVASAKTDDGLVGGTKTKLVDGTKSLGDGVATGTKKMGDGITSGAKASGSLFMKGAKAIGFKGDDDKSTKTAAAPKKKDSKDKLSEKSSSKEPKQIAEKKKDDDSKGDDSKGGDAKKKDDKKKGGGVLSPISNMYKGTVFEIKDGLHAGTDKLHLTKPNAGKDSAAERVAKESDKKAAKTAKTASTEGTYVSRGKPVRQKSNGGLVTKALGKLPFMGSKKSSDSELANPKVARHDDPDALIAEPDDVPRKTADKSESPIGL